MCIFGGTGVVLVPGSKLTVRLNQYSLFLNRNECLLVPKWRVDGVIKGEYHEDANQREGY